MRAGAKTFAGAGSCQSRSGLRLTAAASNRLRGVIASRGLAVGRAITLKAAEIAVVEAGRGHRS